MKDLVVKLKWYLVNFPVGCSVLLMAITLSFYIKNLLQWQALSLCVRAQGVLSGECKCYSQYFVICIYFVKSMVTFSVFCSFESFNLHDIPRKLRDFFFFYFYGMYNWNDCWETCWHDLLLILFYLFCNAFCFNGYDNLTTVCIGRIVLSTGTKVR